MSVRTAPRVVLDTNVVVWMLLGDRAARQAEAGLMIQNHGL